MNRKTMVLTAAAGLLTPALAACGSASGGGAGSGAIVVGTTDRFEAADYAPAPFDPAYAYDAGAWNILRQTVQTLMHTARRRPARPRSGLRLPLHRRRQRELPLHPAPRSEVRRR